ncbi:MAG TPA: helix-turn-helix transcriptional regulator, partial [Streptosporangiaceae bacterium]|nr:helix-turn-helix transcriptional regulator [Streptosporangiaceae bacterium]
MPDPHIADIWRRSRNSTRPARPWIAQVDGARLREARIKRGLSHRKLAADSGVSPRTMSRLENQPAGSCHRATLYRIAAA